MIKLWRQPLQLPAIPSVATVGAFDGLHVGHRQIIEAVVSRAKIADMRALVVLFEPQPKVYFSTDDGPGRLMRLTDKLQLLAQWSVTDVVCLRFNAALAKQTAKYFVADILCQQLGVRQLIIGQDARFGCDQVERNEQLQSYGAYWQLTINAVPFVKLTGQRVSSSRVRQHLQQGECDQVLACLGRAFTISGRVCPGQQRGSQLGFATANIAIDQQTAPLLRGVYAVKVAGLPGESEPVLGVANIGWRPTVTELKRAWCEVHLFDWSESLYGQRLTVSLCHKIRQEQKFASINALTSQIRQDIAQARHYFLLNAIDS